MALKNRRSASDMIPPAPSVVLLYGPPNSGKTTICATAGETLFLDFERSLARSDLVGEVEDRVDVDRWEDVASLDASDLEGVETGVVDTAGELVQKLATFVQGSSDKMRNRDGSISLKGFAKIGDIFNAWANLITGAGANLILTAHSREDKTATDDVEIRPDIMGQSLKLIVRRCTAIGYCTIRGKQQRIEWLPKEWWAKGPREWGEGFVVPNLLREKRWFSTKLQELKGIERARQEKALEASKALQPIEVMAEEIKDASRPADAATEALAAAMKLPEGLQAAAKGIIWKCAQASGLTYDRTEEVFVEKDTEA